MTAPCDRKLAIALAFSSGVSNALLFGCLIGLVYGIRLAGHSAADDYQPTAILSWSWPSAFRGAGLSLLGGGTLFGVISTVLEMGPLSSFLPFRGSDEMIVTIGLLCCAGAPMYGVIVAFVGVLMGGLRGRRREWTTVSNQGIRQSLANALITLVLFGLWGCMPVGALQSIILARGYSQLLDGLLNTIMGALGVGLIAFLLYGGLAVCQHYTVRAILSLTGRLPWNLTRFLDDCAGRIFLRKVGGGYIFIHRLLLEYFASLEANDIQQLTE